MNFLAIDTCSYILSVSVSNAEKIFSSETEASMKHSELVMDCIDNLMKKAGLTPSGLDCVLCMGGPGSFTGLRIGYSATKGIACSLSIPFIPIPSLDCIAYSIKKNVYILAVINAGKNTWFYAVYYNGETIVKASEADAAGIAGKINELKTENKKITITGHGASSLYENLPSELKKITINNKKRGFSGELIAIAKTIKLMDNYNEKLLFSGPEYIRKTDAEINLEKNRIKNE